MSIEQRSALMSRIRGKGTKPEKVVAELLTSANISFDEHAADLPGRPDIVIRTAKIAVFIDGDFWHGWQFERWRHKLAPEWEKKIAENRRRDKKARADLKNAGWTVVRLWEHQIKKNAERCVRRLRKLMIFALAER